MNLLPLPVLQTATADVSFWSWSADPGVAFGVTLAGWYYLRAARRAGAQPVSRLRMASFFGGLAAVVVALLSPIGVIADDYLLSVHMVQHLLLTVVAPPLIILGTPRWMFEGLQRIAGGAPWRVWRFVTRPVLAFVLFQLPFALFHAPVIYDLGLRSQPFHIFEHLIFMLTAFVAWWPVLAPGRDMGQLSPPLAMLYLFASTLPGQIVGALITYADHPLYDTYANAARLWGLSPLVDQQIGGLIMWLGTSTLYLTVLAIVFFRWAGGEDRAERQRYGGGRPSPPGPLSQPWERG
jgi:putative membrane protein